MKKLILGKIYQSENKFGGQSFTTYVDNQRYSLKGSGLSKLQEGQVVYGEVVKEYDYKDKEGNAKKGTEFRVLSEMEMRTIERFKELDDWMATVEERLARLEDKGYGSVKDATEDVEIPEEEIPF